MASGAFPSDPSAVSIELLGWQLDPAALAGRLGLWEAVLPYALARDMYHGLAGHPMRRAEHNVPHDPFEEMVSVYSDGDAFVKPKRARGRPSTVAVYFPSVHDEDEARRTVALAFRSSVEIRRTAGLWPDEVDADDLVERAAAGIRVRRLEVSPEFHPGSVAANPKDALLFDVISSLVWRQLDGLSISAPRMGTIIGCATGVGHYHGCDYLLHPAVKNHEHDEWLAEVAHLAVGTMCGSRNLFLFFNLITRRWRPLTERSTSDRDRTFDILPEPVPGRRRRYHTVTVGQRPPGHPNMLINALLRTRGRPARSGQLLDYVSGAPTEFPTVMPRFGSVHGDRQMRVGAGTSYDDRKAVCDALTPPLVELGCIPIGHARQVSQARARKGTPYSCEGQRWKIEEPDAVRGAIRRTLSSYGYQLKIRIESFATNPGFHRHLEAALFGVLGEPEERHEAANESWHASWDGGALSVEFARHRAGPLAEKLPIRYRDDFMQEAMGRLRGTLKQRQIQARDEWRRYCNDIRADSAARIKTHIDTAVSMRTRGVQARVGFVQMPAELLQASYRHPYTYVKCALAQAGFVSQMFLGEIGPGMRETDYNAAVQRMRSCVEDILRMLGVPAFPTPRYADANGDAASDVTIGALYAIRSNPPAGTQGARINLPIAMKVERGASFVAIPGENDAIAWQPYPEAIRRVLCADYPEIEVPTARAEGAQTVAFFRNALMDLNARSRHAVVMLDGPNIRSWLATVQNARMRYDRLDFIQGDSGAAPPLLAITASDLPNLRVVRVSSERFKTPQYSLNRLGPQRAPRQHEPDKRASARSLAAMELRRDSERQRAISGIFVPDCAAADVRALMAIKARPQNLQTSNFYAVYSRHAPSNDAAKQSLLLEEARATPDLDEMVVLFMQPGDQPVYLVKLLDDLRESHFQYDGDTRLPSPLHELGLVKKAVLRRDDLGLG